MSTVHKDRKFARNYSELKLTVKSDYDPSQTLHHSKTARRKISMDVSKTIKHLDRHLKYEELKLEERCQYRLSTEVLSFQMEEQRSREMRTISLSPQLNTYYTCFKRLFMSLYQASYVVLDNPYKISKAKFQRGQLQLIPVLLLCDRQEWQLEDMYRLQSLAKNISLFSSTPNEFERRIDQVARKVSLHNTKRTNIQNAFLNPRITTYWKRIEEKFSESAIASYLEDQFQSAQSKLCLIEIQYFVQNQLCGQEFGDKIRKYCRLQEIDEDMNFDFKFQFMLTEQLCFNSIDDLLQKQDEATCSLI